MRGYDGDISRVDLDQLYLSMRSAWKGEELGAETAKAERIICRFEHRDLGGRRREGVDVNAVLENHNDA